MRIQWGRYDFPHFTEKETEALLKQVAGPRSVWLQSPFPPPPSGYESCNIMLVLTPASPRENRRAYLPWPLQSAAPHQSGLCCLAPAFMHRLAVGSTRCATDQQGVPILSLPWSVETEPSPGVPVLP